MRYYQPRKINAEVLLSDGRNDTEQTETRAQMLARLAALHEQAPILVFTLAYGRDADSVAPGRVGLMSRSPGTRFRFLRWLAL